MNEVIKKEIIKHLREVTSCIVEESNTGIDFVQDRFGRITSESAIERVKLEFQKVKLSQISNNIQKVRSEYYGKNI